ncbi:MAG: histidinol-phosphatase [Bacteroidia bacterium]|nr:histidinol-phosphatase [Bacteroidia bacterium]MCX7651955.1 histidinol-phosphatase [Bacteroidia bacterium]MDW8416106.1 CpsB/CapC family capsule biosynthesis tyrosine phosphatase [Bacteroidia bacterium]
MWFFSKKTAPINLGAELLVELHNHVLPGVDDGAHTMQEALQMMFFWAEMGYQKVIATPHQNTSMNPTADQIDNAESRLRAQLQEQELPIFLTTAAEYLVEPEFRERIPYLRTFGPKRYVLVELGFWLPPLGWESVIFELYQQGYTPVIAHPERYEFADRQVLKAWYEKGYLMQVNLLSISRAYGRLAQEKATYLLEKGWVHFLGSDMHSPKQIGAVREALSEKLVRRRFTDLLNPTLL